MKNYLLRSTLLVVLLSLTFSTGRVFAAPQNAQTAIDDAQKSGKYVFVMFYEKKDAFYKAMEVKLKDYTKSSVDKPSMYSAKITDSKEAEIVAKYRVMGAPMPLLLVFAPNGAITGGFPQQVTDQQLKSSFPDALILKILKPMQEGKLVLVMLQNAITKSNKESTKAAEDFANAQGLKGGVDLLYADPNDEASKTLVSQSKIVGPVSEATIIMIMPPGRIGGVFPGKTSKEKLMTGLKSCSAGSCKPGACGPKK